MRRRDETCFQYLMLKYKQIRAKHRNPLDETSASTTIEIDTVRLVKDRQKKSEIFRKFVKNLKNKRTCAIIYLQTKHT